MPSILDQLENDSAILLIYLADELPAADRAQVQKRLESDPAFRAQLDDLVATHEVISTSLESADQASRAVLAVAARMRWLTRTIAQWQVDRLTKARNRRAPVVRPGILSLSRLVPAAVAAVLLIGFVAWWDNVLERQRTSAGGPEIAMNNNGLVDQTGATGDQEELADADQADDAGDNAILSSFESDLKEIAFLRESDEEQP